jgi:hypothetical protein
MIIDGFVSLVYFQVFYESWAALISRILILWAVACRFGGEWTSFPAVSLVNAVGSSFI